MVLSVWGICQSTLMKDWAGEETCARTTCLCAPPVGQPPAGQSQCPINVLKGLLPKSVCGGNQKWMLCCTRLIPCRTNSMHLGIKCQNGLTPIIFITVCARFRQKEENKKVWMWQYPNPLGITDCYKKNSHFNTCFVHYQLILHVGSWSMYFTSTKPFKPRSLCVIMSHNFDLFEDFTPFKR